MHDSRTAAASAECVQISPELTVLLGVQLGANHRVPENPIALVIGFGDGAAPPTLHVDLAPGLSSLSAPADEPYRQVFLVARAAVERLGGLALLRANKLDFFLPTELRAIAISLREPPTDPETRTPYRGAKCIELLCETIRLARAQQLTPLVSDGVLSIADTRRIIAARRLVDERWNEKLTLDDIARACGLNRAKLTRGFREMFECTVFEAMAERRLQQASRLLLTTDLPVSSVGYQSGYLNNASFTRAFGRHFGRSPSDYRACGAAA